LELGFSKISTKKLYNKLNTIEDDKLLRILAQLEEFSLQKKYENNELLQDVKYAILSYIKNKTSPQPSPPKEKVQALENIKIKVKLSYSNKDFIKVTNGNGSYDIEKKGNVLIVNGSEQKIFTLSP